jgi:peptide methionine sulfoxide reductase MsrA
MELRKTNNFSGDNVIYFAGGATVHSERFFRFIKGVISTELGYANCKAKHPDCGRLLAMEETL